MFTYYGVLFRIMPTPRTISFRIDSEKVAQLDLIAKAMDRDRSYLLNEAVEGYLSEQRRFAAMVEEGLEASRKGELIDDEEVGRMIESWNQKEMRNQEAEQQKVGVTA
jgi:predicted transcriptional regulator